MDTRPPFWVVDAVPPALSDLVYHLKGDYTSLRSVSQVFYAYVGAHRDDPRPYTDVINEAINRASTLTPTPPPSDTILLGNDDKGIVDLVKLAFVLFGRDSARIIDAYFLILFVSLAVFVARLGRDLLPMAVAALFLAAHYSILPLVYHNAQLQSVLALRFLPVLSLIACLHCVWFASRPDPGFLGCTALALQIAIVVFTVHLRSVTMWQLAVILIAGPLFLLSARRRRPFNFAPGLRWLPALFALSGIVALGQYRRIAYSPEYRTSKVMATRNFWHNIISGFAFHPALAREYELKVDDSSEAHATGRYLTQTGRAGEWVAIGGMPMNAPWNWAGGASNLNFGSYDLFARDFLWSIVRQHPVESFTTFVYYKPRALLKDLLWAYGFRRSVPDVGVFVSPDIGEIMALQLHSLQDELDRRKLRFCLWSGIMLLTALATALLWSAEPRLLSLAEWRPLALVMAGSILPTIIGYPGLHTIAESIVMFALVPVLLVTFALARILAAVRAWKFAQPGA
jgi:hypothetical protein